jgi:cobalt-zinc-cadmium efflux system membrane fusion protein
MLASMLIEARALERMVVPASAVVRENDEDHVFVAQGDAVFRLTAVKLGPEQAEQRVVMSGLKGNEKIVIDGAFHLNNERNRMAMEGS